MGIGLPLERTTGVGSGGDRAVIADLLLPALTDGRAEAFMDLLAALVSPSSSSAPSSTPGIANILSRKLFKNIKQRQLAPLDLPPLTNWKQKTHSRTSE